LVVYDTAPAETASRLRCARRISVGSASQIRACRRATDEADTSPRGERALAPARLGKWIVAAVAAAPRDALFRAAIEGKRPRSSAWTRLAAAAQGRKSRSGQLAAFGTVIFRNACSIDRPDLVGNDRRDRIVDRPTRASAPRRQARQPHDGSSWRLSSLRSGWKVTSNFDRVRIDRPDASALEYDRKNRRRNGRNCRPRAR